MIGRGEHLYLMTDMRAAFCTWHRPCHYREDLKRQVPAHNSSWVRRVGGCDEKANIAFTCATSTVASLQLTTFDLESKGNDW